MQRRKLSALLVFAALVVGCAVSASTAEPALSVSSAAVVRAPSPGQWSIVSADLSRPTPVVLDSGAAVVVTSPGRAVVIWSGNGRLLTVEVAVGSVPQPKPVDPPAPQPPPMATTLYVTVIYEAGDLTVEQSRVLNDAAVVKWISDGKHRYREIDDDVVDAKGKVPAELANHLKLAAEVGEPAVIVTDDAGTVLAKFKVPATGAEFLKTLQGLVAIGRDKP